MNRRRFLQSSGGLALTAKMVTMLSAQEHHADTTRFYLRALVPTKEHVRNFLRGDQWPERLSRNHGWTFDPDLGRLALTLSVWTVHPFAEMRV